MATSSLTDLSMSLVLSRVTDNLKCWLSGPCFVKFRKPHLSKFEQRVKACLLALGVAEEGILHEVTLPIRVTFEMRRYLDAAGIYQRGDVLELRVDMAFLDERREVVLVEVDGSQHGGSHRSWNRSTGDIQRAHRRDVIKHAVLSSGSLRLVRVGSEFERGLGFLLEYLREGLRSLPTAPPPVPPPPCLALGLVPEQKFVPALAPLPASPLASVRRSRSEPTRRKPGGAGAGAGDPFLLPPPPSHDPIIRTRFNRRCKEYVLRGGHSAEITADHMGMLRDRQTASDTRKRPRDDAGFDYTLRWWKLCDHWWVAKGEEESMDGSGTAKWKRRGSNPEQERGVSASKRGPTRQPSGMKVSR